MRKSVAEDVVRGRPLGLAARLEQPDLEHLARVVPLVDGRVDVEALVALEPDQPGAERRGQDLGQLGLADAGLALEEERPTELEGQEDGGRQRPVGDVVAGSGSRPGWPRWNGSRRAGCRGRRAGSSTESTRPATEAGRACQVPAIQAVSPCASRWPTLGYTDCQEDPGEHPLAKGRDEGTLSVLRTEDVPLQEVSGVCLRREAGGDMALVAFGDRTSIAAWVELPSDDRGAYIWQTVDLADVDGSQIPRDDPQVEAVCADGAGRILILQESPPRVELLDWAAHRVATRIALDIPTGHPLHDSWIDTEGSQGEGAAFMNNGHLLIAKEKDPSAFIEFGPAGEAATGFDLASALDGGARWPIAEGDHVFVPLAVWMPTAKLERACADFSDLEVGPDRRLYLLSDKSATIARLDILAPDDDRARADAVWELPPLDGKPEGLALTRHGRAIVALDTKKAKENLVLLDPPIAEGATS